LQATRAQLRRGGTIQILMGEVEEEKNPNNGGIMNRRKDVVRPEQMIDMLWFEPALQETAAAEYVVPDAATKALEVLRAHGVQMRPVKNSVRGPAQAIEQFVITANTSTQNFEGHNMRRLEGSWQPAPDATVPAGAWLVPMNQPLARLAFYLLEPTSDDGLANWNLLDDLLQNTKTYPIVRKR
ncbi:MAG: hypothetical protein HY654_11770, partial [Acidobacteria bacterium]|nr:hypothetical protein [Acidobacteriota bacterium]